MLTQPTITDVLTQGACKLSRLDDVIQTSEKKENFIPYVNVQPWSSLTLSHGLPGLIVLFSEMDHFFPGSGWDQKARQSIGALVDEIDHKGISNVTLYSGLTGICFAIYLASKEGSRYQSLLSALESSLIHAVKTEYIEPIQKQLREGRPCSSLHYDAITGINGVLSYLLLRQDNASATLITKDLLQLLVNMTYPIYWKKRITPGWIIDPQDLMLQAERESYTNGCFDTGLAHGVSGTLSILSKANLQGIQVDGQLQAIRSISDWLIDTQCTVGEVKMVWPGRFTFDAEEKNACKCNSEFYRDGWCYGAPGIACSLFAAASALNEQSLATNALSLMHEACDRYVSKKNLTCPSFCHGLAGLLTMLHQMYLATKSKKLKTTFELVLNDILAKYDESLPFGFKSEASIPHDEIIEIDNAGLLDGTTGTLLALTFVSSDTPRPWLSLFLI